MGKASKGGGEGGELVSFFSLSKWLHEKQSWTMKKEMTIHSSIRGREERGRKSERKKEGESEDKGRETD